MVKIKKVKNKAFLMTASLSKKLTDVIGCLFCQGVNETKGVAASMRKLGISRCYCHQNNIFYLKRMRFQVFIILNNSTTDDSGNLIKQISI